MSRTKDSASRLRFRPPRPTGLPPRGCPLFVEPLGRSLDLVALRARCKREPMASAGDRARRTVTKMSHFAESASACDPHRVLAAPERPAVEPAVAGLDGEAGLAEERVPALRLEPRERHRRRAARPADGERQRLRDL